MLTDGQREQALVLLHAVGKRAAASWIASTLGWENQSDPAIIAIRALIDVKAWAEQYKKDAFVLHDRHLKMFDDLADMAADGVLKACGLAEEKKA